MTHEEAIAEINHLRAENEKLKWELDTARGFGIALAVNIDKTIEQLTKARDEASNLVQENEAFYNNHSNKEKSE